MPLHFDRAERASDDDGDQSQSAAEGDGSGRRRRLLSPRVARLALMALEIGGCMAVVAVVYGVAYVSRN